MKQAIFITCCIFLLSLNAYAGVPEKDPLADIQPGPDGKIDVLTVFAHQDDEGFYGGGTLLKMKKDPRVRLHILCMTLGDMSIAKNILGISSEHLGRIRVEELETAAAVYQADEVIQFQYHDQGLSSADQEQVIREIVAVIERTSAELVITHDPPGITGHPDHQATSRLATEAFLRSSAQKLYYVTFPRWAYHLIYHGLKQPPAPTFKVDIRKEKKLKRMVLYAHASQKHFSEVGGLMEVVRLFNHEWFVEAGSHQ